MAEQDPSGAKLTPTDPYESARKLEQVRAEFPLGIAPYTTFNLITFGFFGGILGAGIAGAVNLRRTNRSRSIPALILLALVLLIVYLIVWSTVNDEINLSLAQSAQASAHFILALSYVILGIAFAAWIGWRQRVTSQRWLNFVGSPSWRDQGGCLGAVGWVILSSLVTGVAVLILVLLFAQPILQITHPPQRYTAEGVSMTTPAGWAQKSPESFDADLDCNASGVTCLAIADDLLSGSTAIVRIEANSGETPETYANQLAAGIQSQYPALANITPQAYVPAFLNGRDAVSLSGTLNDTTFLYTIIGDGSRIIRFVLNCTAPLQPTCAATRDQMVSTMEFSSVAATPEALPIR